MSSTAIEDSGEDDIKLQKVSQTLIQEIRGNLPSLLWQKTVDQQGNKRVHCWVYANKRKRIVSLVRPPVLCGLGFAMLTVSSSKIFKNGLSC